jgi:hypothetical protein
MKKVARNEVRSRGEYTAIREEFRRSVMAQKERRRIHVGPYLTFLFENHDTVLYQIQEMMRAEGIDGEEAIHHEIATYNELLGDRGELGCTLLVEIEDKEKRPELLARWRGLPDSIYLKTRSGQTIQAKVDPNQVGAQRISSVQYLKFTLGDQVPERLGCSHPDINSEVTLTPDEAAALCEDLL